MAHVWQRGEYRISTDKNQLDLKIVHGFLETAYWSPHVPLAVVKRAIEHSLTFGVYRESEQIGFARVITDYATFAYLADVFILESFRGQGLGQWLIEVILSHPELQGFRRWMLGTRDAHELYRRFGFTELNSPQRFMEIWHPNVYRDTSHTANESE